MTDTKMLEEGGKDVVVGGEWMCCSLTCAGRVRRSPEVCADRFIAA